MGIFSAGVYADGVVKQITAYQNFSIKIKVNGSILDLNDNTGSMDPIIYNGHSYVPAKELGEALGAVVQ
ncbi:stalk domain-containing protein [Paenibacillus ferrarius]|uniref:stalk domain-containing protein n=1 Tax=Paenibacillus ferrarius TaxID=1469647 RepID=UPI003CC5D525